MKQVCSLRETSIFSGVRCTPRRRALRLTAHPQEGDFAPLDSRFRAYLTPRVHNISGVKSAASVYTSALLGINVGSTRLYGNALAFGFMVDLTAWLNSQPVLQAPTPASGVRSLRGRTTMMTAEYIHALTRLDSATQNRLAQYYAGLPAAIREQAHERQRDLVQGWVNRRRAGILDVRFPFDPTRPGANGYAGLLVALSEIRTAERAIAKGRNVDADTLALCDQVRQARANDSSRRAKASPKRDLVLKHMELIGELRDQGQGWRQIAKHPVFSGGKGKSSVTYVLLFRLYTEELRNRELREVLANSVSSSPGPKAKDDDPQMRLFPERPV